MTPEPGTEAGLYLYHGIAIRGHEQKALRSILAIEAEARAAVLAEVREGVEGLKVDSGGILAVSRETVLELLDTLSDGGPTDG